ncbi:hypothetical protein [Streptomyces microflavus]|uniref:hypothetical protein n=1 Tax=Streptomyces microflavus TaxID=1919 RepID=UPI0033E32DB2
MSQLHEQTLRIAKVEALVNTGADPLAAEEIAEGLGLPVVPFADMWKYGVVFTCSPAEVREFKEPCVMTAEKVLSRRGSTGSASLVEESEAIVCPFVRAAG